MVETNLVVQSVDLTIGPGTSQPQPGLVLPKVKLEAIHAIGSSYSAASESASTANT